MTRGIRCLSLVLACVLLSACSDPQHGGVEVQTAQPPTDSSGGDSGGDSGGSDPAPGGDSGGSPGGGTDNGGGTTPVVVLSVNAGSDQTALGASPVNLTGTASADDGNTALTYTWSQLSGESVSLSASDTLHTEFTAPHNDQSLSFRLTVTHPDGTTQSDDVSVQVDNQLQLAPSIASLAYVSTDLEDYPTEADCPSYQANYHEPSWNWSVAPIYEFNATSLAVIMGDNYSNIGSADAADLVTLQSNTTWQQNLATALDEIRRALSEDYFIDVSNTIRATDGLCYRTALFVGGTWLWPSDLYPISGAGTGSYNDRMPWMRVPHFEILEMAKNSSAIPRTIPHELIHAQQLYSTRGYWEGWAWYVENYAMYAANMLRKKADYLPGYHFMRQWSVDSSMTRYNTWVYWVFLADQYGREYVADILRRRSDPDETLFEYIRRTAPFDCAANDTDCRSAAMANMYAQFANSTVNYGIYSSALNMDVRTYALDTPWGDPRVTDHLIQLDDTHYRIPDWLAPQRFAHNIIRLVRDPASDWLSIKVSGWQIAARATQWRYTLIATLDSSALPPLEARQAMAISGTQQVNIAAWEAELGQPIERLELVVAAVPYAWDSERDLPPFSGPRRLPLLERYVYELELNGAWPLGHEPAQLRSAPGVSGSTHSNGGGFVASTASVAGSAYVGPEARVLGYAQVTDNARITGRATVAGSAQVGDNAIVSGTAYVAGSAHLSGNATVRENADLRESVQVSGDGKIQGDGFYYSTFNVSGQAMVFGSHINTMTTNATFSGTAVSNGYSWIDAGSSHSLGSSDDAGSYWSIADNGLLWSYDFETPHPYRIKDIHADQDAFYLAADNRVASQMPLQNNVQLSSSVLQLSADGYVLLPRGSLDQSSYSLSLLMNADAANSGSEYVFDASTAQNEMLSVVINRVDNQHYQLHLYFRDRDGNELSNNISDSRLVFGNWALFSLVFDNNTKNLSINLDPQDSGAVLTAAITLPYATREMDYDSLTLKIGQSVSGSGALHALVDDIKLVR